MNKMPQEIKKEIALHIEAIPLGEQGSIYNWAYKMYADIFDSHHLKDFPELKEARLKDDRMRDDDDYKI